MNETTDNQKPVRSDAWGTAALGGDPSRGRLGYKRCPFGKLMADPCGHDTSGAGSRI